MVLLQEASTNRRHKAAIIVLIGFVFPMALEYAFSCCPDNPELLYATGIFLLCGGFFLRLGVLASGVKEQLPMRKYMEMKYQLGVSNPTPPPDH